MTDHERRMVEIYLGSVTLHATERGKYLKLLEGHKDKVHLLSPGLWRAYARCVLIRHRAYLKAKGNLMAYLDQKERSYARAA